MLNFNFQMPSLLLKGETDNYWEIYGIASTEDEDLQNEVIKQKGLDLSSLSKKKIVFNDDHSKKTEDILGIVDEAKITPKGLEVKGKLFKDNPAARTYYNLMKHGGYVGFSIEGAVLERDPFQKNVIKRAKLNAVALTRNPVNEKTYANFLKSLSGNKEEILNDKDKLFNLILERANQDEVFKSQIISILKALVPGGAQYVNPPNTITGGSVFMTESLGLKKKKKKNLNIKENGNV